jgi:hypothetical protein
MPKDELVDDDPMALVGTVTQRTCAQWLAAAEVRQIAVTGRPLGPAGLSRRIPADCVTRLPAH